MIMALELMICAGLITMGACLWYGVERRTERLVARERRETERWRQAYTEYRLGGAADEGWAPMPLPLQLDSQDGLNLQTYGRTAKKRVHAQKAQD